jgi:hypothetical protein
MQGVEIFRAGEQVLAILVRANATSSDKYNFLTQQSEPLQLGMNFYKKGEKIATHTHLPRDIHVQRVQEMIVIGEGRTRLSLYDDARAKVAETELEKGDIVLLASGGHGFDVLEDTKIVEVKQGPYDGKAKDKVAI